jgi:hypothetical protein
MPPRWERAERSRVCLIVVLTTDIDTHQKYVFQRSNSAYSSCVGCNVRCMPPIFFDRSFFGCGDKPAVDCGHRKKKGIGRRSRVSAYHISVCSYLPLDLESLSIRSANFCTPLTWRSFKSAHEELSVFHFRPPRHRFIRVRHRDRKLTEVWCYRVAWSGVCHLEDVCVCG